MKESRESKPKLSTEKVREDAADLARQTKQKARKTLSRAKDRGNEVVTSAADRAEDLSEALDAMASELSEKDRDGLAQHARKLGSGIAGLADTLQAKSVDELATDVKKLARKNPTGFLLGAIALGFGLSRFARASSPDSEGGLSAQPEQLTSNSDRTGRRDTHSSTTATKSSRNPSYAPVGGDNEKS